MAKKDYAVDNFLMAICVGFLLAVFLKITVFWIALYLIISFISYKADKKSRSWFIGFQVGFWVLVLLKILFLGFAVIISLAWYGFIAMIFIGLISMLRRK